MRHRRGEVVAHSLGELEKLLGHYRANGVYSVVITTCLAATGSVETCHGRGTAFAQWFSVHVDLLRHDGESSRSMSEITKRDSLN